VGPRQIDTPDAWLYTSSVSAERRAVLFGPVSFEELVASAKNEIREVRAWAVPGSDPGLTDCLQPVFHFELPTVGDRLFNGPYGYRAQYWRSPMEGLSANAQLLAALSPKLLEVVDTIAQPDLAKFDTCTSLRAASAKFWIQEIPSLLLNPSDDLNVERWRVEAKRGVRLAQLGLSAPETTKFLIKGALLDPHGNEVVPLRKISRHHDIYHYGFS